MMNRKVERNLIKFGGIWNIITGSITLFFYSSWLKKNFFTNLNGDTKGLNYLSENINTFVMTFGLIFILLGSISIYLSNRIIDSKIYKKMPVWFFILGMVSFFTIDLIGVVCYLLASFILLSKNKSIEVFNQELNV